MNHCVPDWNNMEDDSRNLHDLFVTPNHKNHTELDNQLMELLWENGHVVMHSQTNRKASSALGEFKHPPKSGPPLRCGTSVGNSSNSVQEDETASFFQYPLDDSLEKDFCSGFYQMPTTSAKDVIGQGDRYVKFGTSEESNVFTMPPSNLGNADVVNFSHFKDLGEKGSAKCIVVGEGESSSMRTVGSSVCESNQVENQFDVSHTFNTSRTGFLARGVKEGFQMSSPREGGQTCTFNATMTSSSGAGCSLGQTIGQQTTSTQSHKRKGRDGESECHSEEAEYESMEANKIAQRSTSTRKTRAAEVHNLSERRRRDRINEKMKALQELIPHCNKSDKASMLDEAIEYLKRLQVQVQSQIMWMGSGMAPMIFPGVQQHYMSQAGVEMGHAPLPSINSPVQLQRGPLANQSIPSNLTTNQMPMCPSPTLNPANFPTQQQNVHLLESYARYLGFPYMQLAPQAVNLYTYGSHMAQQNQTALTAAGSSLPTAGVPSENIHNGQSG